MACQRISVSRPVRRTTIGYVQFSSEDCSHERCCWQTEDTTPIGSGRSPVSKERGQTFRRNETARRRFASVPICIVHATWSERFFNKIKQCRRIATRYDKLAANYLAFIKLASIRIWLRAYEFTP
jgi:transposase